MRNNCQSFSHVAMKLYLIVIFKLKPSLNPQTALCIYESQKRHFTLYCKCKSSKLLSAHHINFNVKPAKM